MTQFRKLMFSAFLILELCIVNSFAQGQRTLSLIPQPIQIKQSRGTFTIDQKTVIQVDKKAKVLKPIADYLAERLRTVTGFPLVISEDAGKAGKNSIWLGSEKLDFSNSHEAYELIVDTKGVQINAATPQGIFYGVQTLFQLLPAASEKRELVPGITWALPQVEIEDAPRFSWRGMHLDVGRHFMPKEFIKKYIDVLALYKINIFHWHLTEDQGWRIEIKKYPKLTSVGGWRMETMQDNKPHGGFYTQDDIREVVSYAAQRFITIVPEIEMPGHSVAALAAYPELSCSGGPFKVGTEWGVMNDVYCAGKEKTFQFLEDVLAEAIDLFPGPFFHIGGDECPKVRWTNCVHCQKRIKDEGLKDEHELQSYFIKRIEKFLTAKGKRLIGWDEILEGGLAPNATVMSWRGMKGGIDAAKSGHDVVMSPTSHCYFDFYQGTVSEPPAIGGFLPIDTVYAYEPIPSELNAEEAKHVLGAQGNVWTEYIPTTEQAEYMLVPRVCALSEVVWSPRSKRNFADFMQRLEGHYDRLKARGINFRIPPPIGPTGKKVLIRDTVVTMTSPIASGTVYYTLDGMEPTKASSKYTQPITIHGDQVLKARLLLSNGAMSNILSSTFFSVDPKINGIEFNYYEGVWERVPDFNSLTPKSTGIAYSIDADPLQHRLRSIGLRFKGIIQIDAEGDYVFSLNSDDGSKLFIDGKEVINNDGMHTARELSGTITLAKGKHTLEVCYFQRAGARVLDLFIEGPGLPKQPLSPKMLLLR
ncbi:MAG: family 20 glycosylhydrolase [bacterium]